MKIAHGSDAPKTWSDINCNLSKVPYVCTMHALCEFDPSKENPSTGNPSTEMSTTEDTTTENATSEGTTTEGMPIKS